MSISWITSDSPSWWTSRGTYQKMSWTNHGQLLPHHSVRWEWALGCGRGIQAQRIAASWSVLLLQHHFLLGFSSISEIPFHFLLTNSVPSVAVIILHLLELVYLLKTKYCRKPSYFIQRIVWMEGTAHRERQKINYLLFNSWSGNSFLTQ